jgi:hypothetical protein
MVWWRVLVPTDFTPRELHGVAMWPWAGRASTSMIFICPAAVSPLRNLLPDYAAP